MRAEKVSPIGTVMPPDAVQESSSISYVAAASTEKVSPGARVTTLMAPRLVFLPSSDDCVPRTTSTRSTSNIEAANSRVRGTYAPSTNRPTELSNEAAPGDDPRPRNVTPVWLEFGAFCRIRPGTARGRSSSDVAPTRSSAAPVATLTEIGASWIASLRMRAVTTISSSPPVSVVVAGPVSAPRAPGAAITVDIAAAQIRTVVDFSMLDPLDDWRDGAPAARRSPPAEKAGVSSMSVPS